MGAVRPEFLLYAILFISGTLHPREGLLMGRDNGTTHTNI